MCRNLVAEAMAQGYWSMDLWLPTLEQPLVMGHTHLTMRYEWMLELMANTTQ